MQFIVIQISRYVCGGGFRGAYRRGVACVLSSTFEILAIIIDPGAWTDNEYCNDGLSMPYC